MIIDNIVERATEEARLADASDWKIQFELDLSSVLQLVGNLQLALRHPGNNGVAAALARKVIRMVFDGLRNRGFSAHAEIIALGDDSANDMET